MEHLNKSDPMTEKQHGPKTRKQPSPAWTAENSPLSGPNTGPACHSCLSASDGCMRTSEDQNGTRAHPRENLMLILIFFLHRAQLRGMRAAAAAHA
jgi:hypothetical protein